LFSKTVNITLLLLLSLPVAALNAQTDSLRSNISYSTFILPVVLLAAGSAISGSVFEKNVQSDIREFIGNDPCCDIADYTAFVPAAEVFLFDWCGVESRNSFFDRVKYMAIANLASQAVVQSLKYTTDKVRPNGEDRLSFPSNHTNVAFTNAAILYHEYTNSNSLIAFSGFAFAVTTGVLRIVHGEHWTGDVLAGAGIGMLCADLVYRFEPLKNWQPFGTGERNLTLLPRITDEGYGLKLICNF
jgi:hypothetical protein